MSSEEDVLFQVSNVKYKKDEGTLYMMSQRLAWIQENRDTVSVSHHYADIKSQKISPEGKPKIQLQIVLNDSSTFTFQFVHPEGVQTQFALRNQVKEMLLKLLPKFKRQANPELEEKNILLRDNPILTQLYRDLVITDIVTSDEFWKNHAAKYIAEKPSEDLNQALGISSGFLTGIQPATDGVNGIVYNLTSELMDSIFRTYPAVGRKHKECVPMLMSESEFWAKFFQSHYFHRDRLPVSKDVFYSCAKSDDKDMRNEVHALRRSNREIVALIDEAEREESGFTGMSLADPKDVESPGVTAHRNMIKRFNQHSIMLLKASLHNCNSLHQVAEKVNEPEQPKKKRKKDKVLEELVPETAIELLDPALVQENSIKLNNKIELHDLKTLSQPDFQKLHLSKVGRYLNGPVPVYQSTRISMEEVTRAIHGMRESVSRWHAKPYLLDAKMAATLIGELSPGGAIMKTNIPDANSQVVPQEVETELRNTYLSLCELLRHFWSFFPISSPEDTQKLKKCQETLKKFEVVKLQQLKERLLRDHLSLNLMSHLNEMISATEVKYSRSFAVFNKPKRDVRKAFKSMTLPSATVFHLSIDDFLRIFIRTRELEQDPPGSNAQDRIVNQTFP